MRTTANNNRFNESKHTILIVLDYTHKKGLKNLSPRDIARWSRNIERISGGLYTKGLSLACVKSELTRLSRWEFIWRAKNRGAGKNWYVYSALKPLGYRMLDKWNNLKAEGKSLNTRPRRQKKSLTVGDGNGRR